VRRRAPEEKKQLLLDAALDEFAANGIAATRTDAIAARAGCSPGLIYTYFGSKDALFDAVFDRIVHEMVTEVPFTPDDVPGYVGRLFDSHADDPRIARFVAWHNLERRGGGRRNVNSDASSQRKIEIAQQALDDGVLPPHFDAAQWVYLAMGLAVSWSFLPEELTVHAADPADRARRRATVVEAARLLVTAPPSGDAP
jgi:AcrR family transcriptional regulator